MVICDNKKIREEISMKFPNEDKIILTSEYCSGKDYLKDNPSRNHTY